MAQEDFFLILPGVVGESQDHEFKEKIHLTSFSMGVSNAGAGGLNTGSGASRAAVQDIHCTKAMDFSSSNLFISCCGGKAFPTAKLIARRSGGDNPETYLTYELTDAFISSYSASAAEGGGIAQESFSLNFAKITMTYFQQADTGGTKKSNPKTYDVRANKIA